MRTCNIAWEDVVAFCEGRGDGRVREHLDAGCRRCQRRTALLGRVLGALTGRDLEAPPEGTLARARALFTDRFPAPESPLTVLARLLFDSRLDPLPAFARGGGGIHCVYGLDDGTEIDLWMERTEGGWAVLGQIVGNDALGEARAATLIATDGRSWPARLSGAEWTFDDVAEGRYTLQVEADRRTIVAREIWIGVARR